MSAADIAAAVGVDIQQILDGTLGLPDAQAALVHKVKTDVRLAQTLAACGFAVVLWDTLAYLHQEYRLVWLASWSPLKGAYLLTRYSTLITGIFFFAGYFASFTADTCQTYVKAMPAIATLPALGVSLILCSRAYTLWDNNLAILIFTCALSIIQWVGMMVVAIVKTGSYPFSTGITACIANSNDGKVYVLYWVFPLAVHVFVSIFSILKAWELSASSDAASSLLLRLHRVFISKHGQLYPILIMTVEVIQIAFFASVNDVLRAVLAPLSGFVVTVLACQMVITMHLTTRKGLDPNATTSLPSQAGSTQAAKIGAGGIKAFVTSHQAVDIDSSAGHGPTRPTFLAHQARRPSHSGRMHVVAPFQSNHSQIMEKDDKEKGSFFDTSDDQAEEESIINISNRNRQRSGSASRR